jgi:hypothetical protein
MFGTTLMRVSQAKENRTMATGKKPASEAGSQLGSRSSTPAERSVAGSDLGQAPKKKKGKGKKKK